jgi:fructan beta-fructosidase
MNDPNGLVLADGRWHAYYQHHPFDDRWGPMHWGHASSADGLHWRHHPVALAPDPLGTIFSGSIVVDHDGVAGFGRGAWVAFFTHHDPDHALGPRQSQSLAFSTDGGTVWTKYPGNPVLPGDVADFRDPKVVRLGDGRWCMATTYADHLAFHVSTDLLDWAPVGTFRADLGVALGVDVGNWECPDLVALPDGRWMLLVSLSTGGVQGHSGTVVLIGEFDDGVFTPVLPPQRLDHGPDCYAWQTFHGTAAHDVVGMAWANSWTSAHHMPSTGRRGVLTLPRRLRVDQAGAVHQWPAVDPPVHPPADEGGAQWVQSAGDVEVRIDPTDGVEGSVIARVVGGTASIVRAGGVAPGYDGTFTARVATSGPNLIVVDHGIVEVFAGGGAVALTAQIAAGSSPVVTRC